MPKCPSETVCYNVCWNWKGRHYLNLLLLAFWSFGGRQRVSMPHKSHLASEPKTVNSAARSFSPNSRQSTHDQYFTTLIELGSAREMIVSFVRWRWTLKWFYCPVEIEKSKLNQIEVFFSHENHWNCFDFLFNGIYLKKSNKTSFWRGYNRLFPLRRVNQEPITTIERRKNWKNCW